ncbi:hypothetical protein BN2476_640138 [Paraburkholderia piptadeniae]|uniref:Uncharacterized protein n=1 Tax=Paraburkholderia piptadeniae TaxID=1701573 RepID=A0A1N7SMM2_9BURK|nr:hypothetical protein BN2476_640138 [Paraburkholderia piptadeniae]
MSLCAVTMRGVLNPSILNQHPDGRPQPLMAAWMPPGSCPVACDYDVAAMWLHTGRHSPLFRRQTEYAISCDDRSRKRKKPRQAGSAAEASHLHDG